MLIDGVLDAARLGALLGVEVTAVADGRERFGLTWAGKGQAVRSSEAASHADLLPDVDKSQGFIGGGNLEVLKLLQKAYNDKMKLIYIESPLQYWQQRLPLRRRLTSAPAVVSAPRASLPLIDRRAKMTQEPGSVHLDSLDVAAENRQALAAIFPGVFADGVLDVQQLTALTGLEATQQAVSAERYGLHWAGKQEALRSLVQPSKAALMPDLAKSLQFEAARNVFIEGDSLEVLKLLQKAYNDRIKMIYIDPPYNTGNDFVYNDDFSDGLRGYLNYTGQLDSAGNRKTATVDSAGRRHSRWLSMMYPRLYLARNLLTPNGVLLVSIDDHEYGRLLLMLDEIFGEENYATTFVWQKKKKPSFLHANVGSLTEYIVCVTRASGETFPFSVDVTTAGKKYPLNNAGNPLAVLTFPAGSVQFRDRSATFEPQDMSGGNIVTRLLDRLEVRDGRNTAAFRLEGEWRYGQSKLGEILQAGDSITISKPPFRPNHVKVGGEVKKMHNLLTPLTYGVETNEDGSAQVEALLGASVFNNPKPVGLIKLLCKALTYDDPEALVLDFFAGSGTTAHAVALQNAEDGGRRATISVNLPEETEPGSAARQKGYDAVSDITLARIRAATAKVDGASELGLKVFRLRQSAFRQQARDRDELDLAISTRYDPALAADAVAAEVLLKEGIPLDLPWRRLKAAGADVIESGGTAVVLADELDDSVVEAALGLNPRVIVFLEDAFAHADAVKANAVTNARNLGIAMKTV